MSYITVSNCCGCTACYNICPKKAIQMIPDSEGFSYPKVNDLLCVSCGLCEQVCPIIHKPSISETYVDCVVAQNNSKEVLKNCTSGGFIDALYRYILEEQEGYAVGVAFDSQFMPTHIITDSYEKAIDFRNSKYSQSSMGTVFREIRELLINENHLIFVGTPCQVAGLKSFLRKEYENLITVDLVCRSIPSPKLWHQYLKWHEERYKSKIKRVSCRKKTYGYHSGTLEICFSDGQYYRGSNRVDYYMKSFHHDLCSRPSCYQCEFKTKHRCSDFTVFDSWKPQLVSKEVMKDNDRGFSNVIVHTQKGKKILDNLKNVTIFPADPEKMFQFTGGMESKSIKYPEGRKTFYQELDRVGFYVTMKKYVSITWVDKIIEALKPSCYALKKMIRKGEY